MKNNVAAIINRFMCRQKLSLEKHKAFYHPEYLTGFNYLFEKGFSFEAFSQELADVGWQPVMVDGYLSGYDYFQYLLRREIPVNIQVRPDYQLDFAYFPDMVHDIIGHCPMLASKTYTDFLDEISHFICSIKLEERDRRYLDLHRSTEEERQKVLPLIEQAEAELQKNPSLYYYCNNLALWTIEFGILQNADHTYAYGAALVASPLEMDTLHYGNVPVVRLPDDLSKNQFNFSDLQDCLYATRSFNEVKQKIYASRKIFTYC